MRWFERAWVRSAWGGVRSACGGLRLSVVVIPDSSLPNRSHGGAEYRVTWSLRSC
jgi:hypothetical protein